MTVQLMQKQIPPRLRKFFRPAVKQGNDLMIPHKLAFALQADGWVIRNDCIFSKVAPMPESVSGWHWKRHQVKVSEPLPTAQHRKGDPSTVDGFRQTSLAATWIDCPGCPKCEKTGGYVLRRGSWRHTRSHEYVLMLTKGMGYYADQEKVREANANPDRTHYDQGRRLKSDGYERATGDRHRGLGQTGRSLKDYANAGRNPRSVLTPKPESYSGDHYAVYPSSLITPLIRASCPTRCCPVCGAAWAPVVEKEKRPGSSPFRNDPDSRRSDGNIDRNDAQDGRQHTVSNILGYRPTCTHDAEPIPGTILDPFVGSGTTLAVARDLGLNAIGLDLSPSYLDEHARPRIGLTPSNALEMLPLFQEVNA